MSKPVLTVFLCNGKDCRKAWHHLGKDAPGKWLKRHIEEAGLPYKLRVVKTECMDRCDAAACLCAVHGDMACLETEIRSSKDADRILAALRVVVERSHAEKKMGAYQSRG